MLTLVMDRKQAQSFATSVSYRMESHPIVKIIERQLASNHKEIRIRVNPDDPSLKWAVECTTLRQPETDTWEVLTTHSLTHRFGSYFTYEKEE